MLKNLTKGLGDIIIVCNIIVQTVEKRSSPGASIRLRVSACTFSENLAIVEPQAMAELRTN